MLKTVSKPACASLPQPASQTRARSRKSLAHHATVGSITITDADRVVYLGESITKGDVVAARVLRKQRDELGLSYVCTQKFVHTARAKSPWPICATGARQPASPYSLRTHANTPVATLLQWEELSKMEGGNAFTIHSLSKRISRLREDTWENIGSVKQTLSASMKK
jgi:hypothetical protein